MDLSIFPMEAHSSILVAKRYGVCVKSVLDRPPSTKHPYRIISGPRGNACDPSGRTVYFETTETVREHDRDMNVEQFFHEIVHAIVQPPWWEIDEVPEDFILMQFERSLAKTVFSDAEYRRVVAWQEQTQAMVMTGAALGEIVHYRRQREWKIGFAICRTLGLLDARNRPTFRWPKWNAIRRFKISMKMYMTGYGAVDPWTGERS